MYFYYEYVWDYDPVTHWTLWISDWIATILCLICLFIQIFWGFWNPGFMEYLKKKGLQNYWISFLNFFIPFAKYEYKHIPLTDKERKLFFDEIFDWGCYLSIFSQIWTIFICLGYTFGAIINVYGSHPFWQLIYSFFKIILGLT